MLTTTNGRYRVGYTGTQPKRVVGSPGNSFYYEHSYKGLPVQVTHGPLVAEWLEKLYLGLLGQVAIHSKVFVLRIDLRFPSGYWPPEGQVLGNDYYDRFKRYLKRSLGAMSGNRNHGMWLAAAREYDKLDQKPHFHVLLLLNGNAIRSTGNWDLFNDNLYSRLHDAWAFALGMEGYEVQGLIQFASGRNYSDSGQTKIKGGGSLLNRGDKEMFKDIFYAISYMAKFETKNFSDRCHPFVASRLKITSQ